MKILWICCISVTLKQYKLFFFSSSAHIHTLMHKGLPKDYPLFSICILLLQLDPAVLLILSVHRTCVHGLQICVFCSTCNHFASLYNHRISICSIATFVFWWVHLFLFNFFYLYINHFCHSMFLNVWLILSICLFIIFMSEYCRWVLEVYVLVKYSCL